MLDRRVCGGNRVPAVNDHNDDKKISNDNLRLLRMGSQKKRGQGCLAVIPSLWVWGQAKFLGEAANRACLGPARDAVCEAHWKCSACFHLHSDSFTP